MSHLSSDHTVRFLLIILLIWLNPTTSLKCRTEDGPSVAELKRVTRSCMRKITENARFGNGGAGGSSNNSSSNHYRDQHPTRYGQPQTISKSDYADDDDDDSYHNSYGNRNYNIGNNGRTDDLLHQRNRDRFEINRSGSRSQRAASNNERARNPNGGSSVNQRSSSGNNNHGGSGWNNNSGNNSSNESNCVVHCFFEELNMLNNDNLPDRQKVRYVLTKDLRDRDLRNFYTDTIQECFQYLETQRRRDKCHYSRELINCMTEYAKANCEDWQEYSMMFN